MNSKNHQIHVHLVQSLEKMRTFQEFPIHRPSNHGQIRVQGSPSGSKLERHCIHETTTFDCQRCLVHQFASIRAR